MACSPRVAEVIRLSLVDPAVEGRRDERLRDLVRVFTLRDVEELRAASVHHGVASYVYESIAPLSGVPDPALATLRELRDGIALRHLRTVGDLQLVSATLSVRAIPWLVFKGPTLAEPVHGSALSRAYGDLDLLVPATHLRRSLSALEEVGAELLDRNWQLIDAEDKGELHLRLPSGAFVDLHWHLFNERSRRRIFPVDIAALVRRAREVEVGGCRVPAMDPVDATVYVALHTMHSGANRLMWLKDLERLLAVPDLDPGAVVTRARAWRAEVVLLGALLRAEQALGPLSGADQIRTALPEHRGLLAAAGWCWRRSPAEREDGSPSLGRLVARSLRPTSPKTLLEFVRRSLAFARAPNLERRRFDAGDPRSGAYEAGGTEQRDAFLTRRDLGRTV